MEEGLSKEHSFAIFLWDRKKEKEKEERKKSKPRKERKKHQEETPVAWNP
jgi:hypothetical protein